MIISGNFDGWSLCFPDGCLPEMFRTLLHEWPLFRRAERPLENRITHNFVAHLQRATRWKVPFAFDYRAKLTSIDKDAEGGEVDIVVRAGIDPLVFFGFECKRLNVPGSDDSIRSGATAYASKEGMGCFLSGQYDGGGQSGGMIGYVLDGDSAKARLAVDEAINTAAQTLRILAPKRLRPVPKSMNCVGLEETRHEFRNSTFTIYHLFLPLNAELN